MKSSIWLSLALAFGLVTTSFAQVNAPTLNKDGTLNKTAGLGIDQKLNALVPFDAVFKDETGKQVRFGDYFGKRPVLLSLIFYKCPGMCSLEFEGMVSAFTKMSQAKSTHAVIGQDMDVVTLSIDPNEDSTLAAAKKATAMDILKYPSANTGWHFLTGDLENINKIATAVGFQYTYDPKTKNINHPAGIMLITPEGRISKYFYGTGYPERPLHDAIVMAKSDKIGTPSEVFLLGCLCKDALTGKWSVNVMQTTRVLGVLTLLVLVGSVIKMSRSSRWNNYAGGPKQV
jgi:protein SCO1/2